jgi:hypothetical protein
MTNASDGSSCAIIWCFNAEQCDLPASVTEDLALSVEKPIDLTSTCAQVVANIPTRRRLNMRGCLPFRIIDCITRPPRGFLDRVEAYHARKFHELGHYADIGINFIRPATESTLPALPRSISAHSGQSPIPLRSLRSLARF